MKRHSLIRSEIILLSISLLLLLYSAQESRSQSTFSPVWQTAPWDSGGLHPSSVVWSMVRSELDLDNDGKKEFLVSTSWGGIYYNMLYLYEYVSDNQYQLVWSYSFDPYANDYSAVAIADLNNNGRKEIICLIDPAEPFYHGFYVFEWDGSDNGFPLVPTATWNLNLPYGFDEGTAIIAGDFDNDGRDEVAISIVERWSSYKSRFSIFSLANGSSFANPTWYIEYTDTTTFLPIGYSLEATDLNKNGRKEIVVGGWDVLRIAIYEHTGTANSYTRVANVTNISTTIDFSNMGFAEANFDNNGTNELYMLTTGGSLYVLNHGGNLAAITPSNFTLLHQYNTLRGVVGLSKGDIDRNNVPELYVAGSYHEGVFQWRYQGGAVTGASSYDHRMIYQDDTTDSVTPSSDQGYLRPSKVAVGDFDNDGKSDMVIASASFARDKPVLMVIELSTTDVRNETERPGTMSLDQNYPNPFNPSTNFRFTLDVRQHLSLKIYDLLGREVETIADGEYQEGTHEATWDASEVASGTYIAKATGKDQTLSRRVVLVR